jgi:tripartite-type tricarboxylate transporter receptor subunit TctC
MITKRTFLSNAAAAGLVLAAGSVGAQTYPDRPIKLIVPFAPGGPMDVMGRLIGQQAQAGLKQPVIVENRAGAGGALGSKAVATAEPDGYTLFWGSSGTLSILPALNPNLDYDPKAFAPVALVSLLPHVMVVPASIPVKTVAEFIAHVKANPGKLNFGASLGTPPHLLGALFKHLTGIDIVYIPYKGAANSITDMLGGTIHMQIDALTVLDPLIKEGKLRALAISTPERWASLPDVPTFAESGFPDLTRNAWSGVLAPPRTPAAVFGKLNSAINESLTSAETRATFAKLSALSQPGSPQQFAAFIAEQSPIWAEMVRISGARIDN